ncbi:flagellar protein FliS [Paenibacillus sp. CCS19]|uniref:flagellar export chaperone FliS n=1 Tax=Paenibacillus sp. CCS19 TaxID=3158387 RepID=UPI0025683410|nr:flagellar export chaperone FliS [Paenibacillus cellulosilyticus]GMK38269.1 flagellar protein FliS [Paenibacillus cellulosilyticus]
MLPVQNNYLNAQVQTSTPGELTLLLYNGCIRFIKLAIVAIDKKDIIEKHKNLIRAQDIIDELLSTLNMDYEISHNLKSLYTFLHSKLLEANVKVDRDAAEWCLKMITELRDTWLEAIRSLRVDEKVKTSV